MKIIILLLCFFFPSINLLGQTSFNADLPNITKEIEKITKERKVKEKHIKEKWQKQSDRIRLKRLRHMADSTAFANYMIELAEVTAYARKDWPSYEVYPTLKEAKQAFKEPYSSGGHTRVRFNMRQNFRQPEDLAHHFFIGEWGWITIRFLVDEKGNIIRSKIKTKIAPEVDEKLELAVLALPPFHPAEFGGKKYPSAGTMVLEYEIISPSAESREYLKRKGIDHGGWGNYFMFLKDFWITWSPAITPIL